jgi:hypothetical protein
LGRASDFIRDYTETGSGLARAGGFDGGVQRCFGDR